MKGAKFTLEQARAHAAKHRYPLEEFVGRGIGAQKAVDALVRPTERERKLPTPVQMTRPEREYGNILLAMKRKGEIQDFRWQGMSLAWGEDPKTGRLMRYKCDWLVIGKDSSLTLVETKGRHIYPAHLVRFRGCRAAWPWFRFEMHQLAQGVWRHIE